MATDPAGGGLRRALPSSLATHFGWKLASTIDGPAPPGRPNSGFPMIVGTGNGHHYRVTTIMCTHPPHAGHGLVMLNGPIAGGQHGHIVVSRLGGSQPRDLYLSVSFSLGTAGQREAMILCKLSLHLSAQVALRESETESRRQWTALTPREHDVAELVAAGLTNDQIANRLFITIDTVKKHLTHILSKTRCSSRTQLAIAWRGSRPGRLSASVE
ncbi:response regulator transcription factor [Nonomuraea sp. KM90]|uniref:response regulator transcription factor n=1 Tax=Nonomuraea sp. KM90 TaxID=3457428 RepID=UPI003FCE5F64